MSHSFRRNRSYHDIDQPTLSKFDNTWNPTPPTGDSPSSAAPGKSTSLDQSMVTGRFSFTRQQQPNMDSSQACSSSTDHCGTSFDSRSVFSGSGGFGRGNPGFGGDFGSRMSDRSSGDKTSTLTNSDNCYSFESRSFGGYRDQCESGKSFGFNEGSGGKSFFGFNDGSGGKPEQSSRFSSRLPLLGSGGNLTVVAPGEGEFLFVFVLSFNLYLTYFANR